MKKFIFIISILLVGGFSYAEFPVITKGDISPIDHKLGKAIDKSKQGELTLASFNIRNLGARQRSLKDYTSIVDLIDESDVVMIQEAGLGVYKGNSVSKSAKKRMKSVEAIFQLYLGDNFIVKMPPTPSGTGNESESTILVYRKKGIGYSMSAEWDGYVDIGDKRDMAVFKLTLQKNATTKNLYVGSVHLSPKDPHRGEQMLKLVDWVTSQQNKEIVVMGDFNWGYQKVSGVENYKGEKRIRQLHDSGEIFQLFYHLSYLEKGSENDLRTNMGFRKNGYFYDQFLLTPNLANDLTDGGSFQKDCGILAFDLYSSKMKKVINYWSGKRRYGLDRYFKLSNLQPEDNLDVYEKTLKKVTNQSADDATYILSDHRIIWMKLRVWD